MLWKKTGFIRSLRTHRSCKSITDNLFIKLDVCVIILLKYHRHVTYTLVCMMFTIPSTKNAKKYPQMLLPPSFLSLSLFLSLFRKVWHHKEKVGAGWQIPHCSSLWHWWHAVGLTGAGGSEHQHLHTRPHSPAQGTAHTLPLWAHSGTWGGWKALNSGQQWLSLTNLRH